MKKYFIIAIMLITATPLIAQKYDMRFIMPKTGDSILYIAQHYRDQLVILDSCFIGNGKANKYKTNGETNTYIFSGKKNWPTGIYAIVGEDRKKAKFDITIDGSQRFTLEFSPYHELIHETGSPANTAMFAYHDKIRIAKQKVEDIEKRKKSNDPKVKNEAEKEMELLSNEMEEWEKNFVKANEKYYFFKLVAMFNGPKVPDEIEDKALYYRTHYWDNVDFSDHRLVNTPDLFNKMNYYFFGVLYRADMDTICKYADNVLKRIESDTLMLRYFMDYIMPRYYRSTKNIGWDATWCYLVRKYYLTGKCAWATPSDIANKRQTCEFLEKSLIGAIGTELWMADTNQFEDPNKWISSHRFPQKYVILWFWDPDCHHCQEQTATLKTLYDSLSAAGNKIFEVYAIGYEADVKKWKNYVRDHQLPFVNVGGPNVNVDYQEAYNVHGAPTMIILNEERRIIMNKVLPTNSILPFLERYEQRKNRH